MLAMFGPEAEKECDARAAYRHSQRQPEMANAWKQVKAIIPRVRKGERPPGGGSV